MAAYSRKFLMNRVKLGEKKSRVIKAEKPKKLFHFSFPTTKHYTINGTNDITIVHLKGF